ncbi:aquaporin Z [Kytococcus sedentarius]|uniref:Aquaporin Z n=2 Tax=Kytococcus TaxID=57499 RepID=A0A212TEY1_9MICO|nr:MULTISPECIES: aquaporin Z [Kytococcus]QQB63759.1 aquaporin Z [Kytococcus sedentarius]QRO87433.1 aquaporin Z [Kytococcus sedentarius]SNC64376.1 aquaporin Z [Kytococcus aerolatus]STX13283.1 Bacterial nodulin-like intrinsic protein [Kytococcus sedentarius]
MSTVETHALEPTPSLPAMPKRLAAEALGTFWLVFGGCGSAIFAAASMGEAAGEPIHVGIGYLGVALAFGLTVVTMAYAVGHVSGGHFNPAVTVGLATAGRHPWKDVLPYVVVQVIAGLVAGGALYAIATGKAGFEAVGSMAANGYGANSPEGYSMMAVLLAEVILTAFFLYVILGATDDRAPQGFGPLAIGLALTLIHLISIPVSNTSVNPARSTGVAFFHGDGAPAQLWLFWLAPVLGAVIAGISYHALLGEEKRSAIREAAAHDAA